MLDITRYFQKDWQVFLSHIDFDFLSMPTAVENKLTVKDTISSYNLDESNVKVEIARSLDFGVGKVFSLNVVFTIMLKKNPFSQGEVDWSSVNIANEFRQCKLPVISNIMNRMSMLIAEITAAHTQVPIVTPPRIVG